MDTDLAKAKPMTKDQLKHVKKEIMRMYLFLISHTAYDPMVIEIMKLSALADMQKRYEAKEPWKIV